MTSALELTAAPAGTDGGDRTFHRVIAGVDGSEAGFEAVRQATRLVDPNGRLELMDVVYLAGAQLAGWSEERVASEIEQAAGAAMERARLIAAPDADWRLVAGVPYRALLDEIDATRATLIVLGAHGYNRLHEALVDSVSRRLLADAPCAVLIARTPPVAGLFPREVVAGVDGSPASRFASVVADRLAERFAIPRRLVTATRSRSVDVAAAQAMGPIELVDARPVAALIDASRTTDLLIVGSRGLHGLKRFGSVSERVARHALCSVLVLPAG